RDGRLAAEQDRKRHEDEEKARRAAEDLAREQAEQQAIARYWAAMDPAGQEALKAAALEKANPFFLKKYREHQGKDVGSAARYLKLIVDAHIAAKLGAGPARP